MTPALQGNARCVRAQERLLELVYAQRRGVASFPDALPAV
jgi:hypothetical protein